MSNGSKKESSFEKNLKLSICFIGLILIIYASFIVISEALSNDLFKDFMIKSAFMVSDVESAPLSYTDR